MSTSKTLVIPNVTGHNSKEFDIQNVDKVIGTTDKREKSFKSLLSNEEQEEYLASIKEELQARCSGLKLQIFKIGKLLFEVKKIVPHGKFKPWINDNFEFSYKTALNYMKVYTVCMGNPEIVEYFKPSSLYVIANPKFPGRLREALFEGVKGPVDIKKKDLVQLALKFKKGELNITDKEVQGFLIRHRDISILEVYKSEFRALNQLISKRLEGIKKISTKNSMNLLIEKQADEEEKIREQVLNKIIEQVEKSMDEIDTMIEELDEK